MGRVARYKRVKSCDAFAKRPPSKARKREYDLPPDEDQTPGAAKSGRARRRQERMWAREALGEDDYMALLDGAAPAEAAPKAPRPTIEPRRADESQKAFERRLKDDSMRLIKASNDRHSATRAKKRDFLRRKKAKRAAPPRGAGDPADAAPAPPAPAFGDRADAPPDLARLAHPAAAERKRAKLPKQDGASKADLKAARAAFAPPPLGGWELRG